MSRVLERERGDKESRDAMHKHELQMVEELLNGRHALRHTREDGGRAGTGKEEKREGGREGVGKADRLSPPDI